MVLATDADAVPFAEWYLTQETKMSQKIYAKAFDALNDHLLCAHKVMEGLKVLPCLKNTFDSISFNLIAA